MTPDNLTTDNDTEKTEFVRPSLTIRNRNLKQLNELQEVRYGSRSEAVRAAIELLSKSVLGNGETGIEQLSKQVLQLQDRINDLNNKIDDLQGQRLTGNAANLASQPQNIKDSNHTVPAVETTESQGSVGLQNEIYAVLSDDGPMSIADIAQQLDKKRLEIHENIRVLVEDHEFVTCTNQADTPQYKIKPANTN